MVCMIKFKMIFQSALITSLCLLLCACRADDPETVTPEYAAQSEEPDMLPEETAKKPEQVLLEQLVDDTHDAFLVDTGGELGTLLVTAELDEETPTEDCRATIQFTVWDPYSMDEPLQTLTAGTDIFLDWSIIDANFDGYMDFEGLARMGLYLCIFNQNGDDICGVEVGLYSYFGEFRDLVSKFTNKDFLSRVLKRKSKFSLPMTTLLNHSDCDGSWNVDERVHLKMELQEIKQIFINEPPDLSIIELKQDIFKFYGVKP